MFYAIKSRWHTPMLLALAAALLATTALPAPEVANADTPNTGVTFTGTKTVGSILTVNSSFKNVTAAGTYVLDTEIYNGANKQVAQFYNFVYLSTGQAVTKKYSWNTMGKPAGTYQARQGTFTDKWVSLVRWCNDSGSVTLTAGAPNKPAAVATVAPKNTVTAPAVSPPQSAQAAGTLPATVAVNGNPLSGATFYGVNTAAAAQATAWAASNPAGSALMAKMAATPTASWPGTYNTTAAVNSAVTAASGKGALAVLVAYDIPNRDCGGYSSGGAADATAYASYISNFAAGMAGRKAVVILEPDALGVTTCLSAAQFTARQAMLSSAVHVLHSAGAYVYIDASYWVAAPTMAAELKSANINEASGFALNVSNFQTTSAMNTQGAAISAQLGGKGWVVDTSRNGAGPDGGQWCNPPGRALGPTPTSNTGVAGADAYLWIKIPGGSDGTCNGGPGAGTWWPSYALGLAQAARG